SWRGGSVGSQAVRESKESQVSREELILAGSLLTYWISATTAQVTVEADPPHVAEGRNVLLRVQNLLVAVRVFYWYKGNIVDQTKEIARFVTADGTNKTGPAYSGRETICHNGSLLIREVTKNDTGTYLLQIVKDNYDTEVALVQFQVHTSLPKPNITSNNSNPMEGEESVALMCEPKTENTTYLWRINEQSISEDDRRKLSEGNRTLTLLSVMRTDRGPYECETQNPVSASKSDPFTLDITYGPDVPIITPSKTHFQSRTEVSLSCQSASNPPPQYSWYFNGGLLASSQELFLSNISTNNSGSYTCRVYNSVTGLNRTTVKNIIVLEPVTPPFLQVTNTTVKELDSVVLTCFANATEISFLWLFNGQSLELMDRMKLSQDNSTLIIDPVKREDSGEYQCEISNPVSSKKSDPIRLEIITDPTKEPSGLSGGAIAGIVVGAVAGVTLIAGLAYFLYSRKTGGKTDQRHLTEHKPSASNHNLGPTDSSPKKKTHSEKLEKHFVSIHRPLLKRCGDKDDISAINQEGVHKSRADGFELTDF
ncbi:carcinoembryonic antigen-related cell adhesion molecule 1 isoform X2, partial [Sigmodon hispidus]